MRRQHVVGLALLVAALVTGQGLGKAQGARPPSALLGTLDLMPTLGRQTMPVIADMKQAGQLDAEIVVAADGKITHARVLKSTDATGALDRACIDVMQRWRLKPAVGPGSQPVATLVRIRFEQTPAGADGQAGAVQATLHDILASAPPPWTAVADITVHEPRQGGLAWPKVVREIKPRYTTEAMRAKLQGAVEMDVVVLADGTVGAARLTKGIGLGLDEAALAAARYWLFEPARLNGEPVAAKVGLVLEYRLH